MHCCKRVWKLPYMRLRRSLSIAATSSTMACLSSWIVMIRLRNTRLSGTPTGKKIWCSKFWRPSRPSDVAETRDNSSEHCCAFQRPLRPTLWNGLLSSTVPLPANHDKLSRRRNIQIWNVSVCSAPPCICILHSLFWMFGRLLCYMQLIMFGNINPLLRHSVIILLYPSVNK